MLAGYSSRTDTIAIAARLDELLPANKGVRRTPSDAAVDSIGNSGIGDGLPPYMV